jgi:tetratricopeptide (TPR) repeat protein
LAIHRELADPYYIARSLINLGNALLDQAATDEARVKLEEALAILREVGDRWMLGAALDNLGIVMRKLGNYDEASDMFKEALLIYRDLDDQRMMAYILEDFASLACLQGEPARSLRLAAAAAGLRENIDSHLSDFEADELNDALSSAREGLDDYDQEEATAQGRAMSLERAIDYALIGVASI